MATTYGSALAKIGVSIPGHLVADVEVPVITGEPQGQGDILAVPAEMDGFKMTSEIGYELVPDAGVQVVTGESTGNTHWLHRGFDSPDVSWARVSDHPIVLGVVKVPAGQSAELIHTDEHGCNALGPGVYVLRGKQELADQIRRVAD